jgi:N-acetylglucosamine transport system permease protein
MQQRLSVLTFRATHTEPRNDEGECKRCIFHRLSQKFKTRIIVLLSQQRFGVNLYRHKYRIIIPFLAPALLLYGTFVLYPYAQAMYIALTSWKGLRAPPRFVGLENFQRLLTDEDFWNALSHNAIYLLILPVFTLGFALFLAFMISRRVRFANFYRVTFFFPQVMSGVAIGILWSFIYHPSIGILNSFLKGVGIASPPAWLGNPTTALYAVAAVVIWQSVGFYMVLFMAGMQAIPETFYEVAALDGASRAVMFFRITLPLLWETMRAALVFVALGALDMFGITFTMTQGGPDRSTEVLATYLYEEAFLNSRFGYGTAIAMALFLIVLVLSVALMWFTRRERLEY